MKTNRTLSVACGAMALGPIAFSGALASSVATGKAFECDPLSLVFLGFCALVLLMQCKPAIIMFYGMIREVCSAVDKKALVVASK